MTPVFETRQLTKSFGGLAAVRQMSLTIRAGERVALIGPNGAGKTTFVDLATGAQKPDAGSVWLDGVDVTSMSDVFRVRKGLVRSFQVTRLLPDLTPIEHLALAILQRDGKTNWLVGSFRAMPAEMNEATNLLAGLGIADTAERPVKEIAYGDQRLLELAIALALKPRVLLLDEPAAGVAHGETDRIERALAKLPAELAILMIDHDIGLVMRFARRVVVMAAGAIIFDGLPVDATRDPDVRKAYLGNYADARST